jgi:hypothetical protein
MNGEFFIARGDSPELFEAVEESFDQMTRSVAMLVIATRRSSIGSGWNERFRLPGFNLLHQVITIVAFICNHRFGRQCLVKQGARRGDVGLFGAGQCEPDGVSERIDDAVDFGSEPPARATQSLWAVFLLAPAAGGEHGLQCYRASPLPGNDPR